MERSTHEPIVRVAEIIAKRIVAGAFTLQDARHVNGAEGWSFSASAPVPHHDVARLTDAELEDAYALGCDLVEHAKRDAGR
jgi:hypothetical protein